MPASTESGCPPATTPRRPRTTGRNVSASEEGIAASNSALIVIAIKKSQEERRVIICLDLRQRVFHQKNSCDCYSCSGSESMTNALLRFLSHNFASASQDFCNPSRCGRV